MKNITENFYLTDNDDINHANFSNSKKSNNDKTTMSGYLKDYLIDFDFKKQDEKNQNMDVNTVNLYNNESYLPYLVSIINEKNKFIEELKISLTSFNSKYIDLEQEFNKEVDNLKKEILIRDDKIKVLSTPNTHELVDYYENEIKKLNNDYDKFYKIINISLNHLNSTKGINDKKNIDNYKNIINNLMIENSRLNSIVSKLQYLERTSKIYKNLLFRFGNKVEVNQKVYEELLSQYSDLKSYSENLEIKKKTLEESLNEINRLQQTSIDENIIFQKNKSHSESLKNTCQKFIQLKGGEFIKIINQERIVLIKFIEESREIYSKVFKKVESLDNNLKFYFKKNLNNSVEKLDLIEKELKGLFTNCENYYKYYTSIHNYMNEIKGKFKVMFIVNQFCKDKKDFTVIEDIVEKILNFFLNK